MAETPTIDKTLMTVETIGGDVFSIVTYASPVGGCGISRNGDSVPDCQWSLAEMDACVTVFVRMAEL